MIGTRIILLGLDAFPNQDNPSPAAEMLCAANHEIPIFWLLPFTKNELSLYPVSDIGVDGLHEEPGSEYPLLMAERTLLLQRLKKYVQELSPHLAQRDAELLQNWYSFLAKQSASVLVIDTYELWRNTATPESLFTEIGNLLALWEGNDIDFENTIKQLINSGKWPEGNSIGLSGFGW